MANLVEWVEAAADGEPIEAVVIGDMGWSDNYGSEDVPTWDSQTRNKVLSWVVAREWLNYDFDSGFGAPGCNAIYAWTPTKVIFVSQYDGATSIESIPRHPIDCKPSMPGGG